MRNIIVKIFIFVLFCESYVIAASNSSKLFGQDGVKSWDLNCH